MTFLVSWYRCSTTNCSFASVLSVQMAQFTHTVIFYFAQQRCGLKSETHNRHSRPCLNPVGFSGDLHRQRRQYKTCHPARCHVSTMHYCAGNATLGLELCVLLVGWQCQQPSIAFKEFPLNQVSLAYTLREPLLFYFAWKDEKELKRFIYETSLVPFEDGK